MRSAQVFDPLVRQAIDAADDDEARLLDHLARHGESMNEDVQLELGWDAKRLKRARTRMERVGAVLSDGLVFESSTSWYFAPMRRWDQMVVNAASSDDPLGDIVVAGVGAAVIAPESDLTSWFSWPIAREMVERLVNEGRLYRPAPKMLAVP